MKALARIATAALLASILASAAGAQDGVWVSHGPDGVGLVSGFAFGDSVAYAATSSGVFRSRDRGATWEAVGLKGVDVSRVATCPSASVILATVFSPSASSWTLQGSRDGGETWAAVSGFEASGVAAVDPFHATNAYAVTPEGVVWKSSDSAASWRPLPAPATQLAVSSIALDSHALFVAGFEISTSLARVYRSSDDGVTWSNVSPPIRYAGDIRPGASPGVVYAGGEGGFCRSADSAATWTCGAFPGYAGQIAEISRRDGSAPRLLASAPSGIYFSDDSGTTWVHGELATQPGNAPVLGADPSGSFVLAGAYPSLFRSDDGETGWRAAAMGLNASSVASIALDPEVPSTIWANLASGGSSSLFRSSDGGFTWVPGGGPQTPAARVLALDPHDSSRLYLGDLGAYRSDDWGATWTHGTALAGRIAALAVDPLDSGRVWAGTASGLYRSDDGSATWRSTPVVAQEIYAILFDRRNAEKMYVGSFYDVEPGYYGYPEGGSIFVSLNRGDTFSQNPHDFGSLVTVIADDPFDERTLYVGTGAGVHLTHDSGATWEAPASDAPAIGYVRALVADPARVGRLYAATDSGMYRSLDAGRSWSAFGVGLGSLIVSSLAITPDGHWLHAGTYGGGVFEVDLESVYPCSPSTTRLCLLDARYAVEISAPAAQTFSAHALTDRAGYFVTGSDADSAVPAVAIKILPDGAFGYPGTPFFYSSLTTLPFHVVLVDTVTGARAQFDSRSESPLCGGTTLLPDSEPASGPWDYVRQRSESVLRLLGRFSVTLEAVHPRSGAALHGVSMASSDRFGIFSLPEATGDAEFPEVVVEMDDSTGGFSLVHAGMTGIPYTLTVTDSASGAVRVYDSATPFCGAFDPHAFGD
jgi:photosystem II stability/assembly factor-like uncharacterized protein